MKRLMIVDAFNQFIRGYIVDPSKNPNGQPIGGILVSAGQSIRTTKQAENLLAQTGTKLVWKRMRSRTTKSGSR
jgi:hypothetical protein